MILPHSNTSSDNIPIKYTNQKMENAYGKSSGKYSILGLFVLAAYLHRNAKQQALPILKVTNQREVPHFCFLIVPFSLLFFFFLF